MPKIKFVPFLMASTLFTTMAMAAPPYSEEDLGAEVLGGYHYDGTTVARKVTREHQDGRTIPAHDPLRIRNHEGNSVVFVRFLSEEAPVGDYEHRGFLDPQVRVSGFEKGELVYIDAEGQVFLPHLTQERWEKDMNSYPVLIASYNTERPLHFISGQMLPSVSQGLYHISPTWGEAGERGEKWSKIQPQGYEGPSFVFQGRLTIPGMGFTAPIQRARAAMDEKVSRLLRVMKGNSDSIKAFDVPDDSEGALYLLGPSGAGKSTVATALAGGRLVVQKHRGIFRIVGDPPVEGIHIGHGLRRGTDIPGLTFNPETSRTIFDCPGFGDPAGGFKDILNSLSIQSLLERNGRGKLVLTLGQEDLTVRGRGFVKLLNDITRVFPVDNELQQAVSLLVTRNRGESTQEQLSGMLEDLQDPTYRDEVALDPRSLSLLTFLSENPERTIQLPYPEVEGIYDAAARLDALEPAIEGEDRYVRFSEISFNVDEPGKLEALRLATNVNEYITDYFRSEGVRRVIQFCKSFIARDRANLLESRQRLQGIVTAVRGLGNMTFGHALVLLEPTAEHSLAQIFEAATFEDSQLIHALKSLSFLKRIENEVSFAVSEWAAALDPALGKLEQVARDPQYIVEGESLTLKGALVGLSDVAGELARQLGSHTDITRVNAWATTKLYLDQNVSHPSLSVSFMAPLWEVFGDITLDFSGADGLAGQNGTNGGAGFNPAQVGTNGAPGISGGHGGHFFGKGFEFHGMDHLTVNVNGGNGGNGGNAGHGGDGANGANGNTALATFEDGDYRKYENLGTNGANGGDAGQCGQGGFSGSAGSLEIQGYAWETDPQHTQSGQVGQNGQMGIPGVGGVHGQHSQGVYHKTHQEKYRRRVAGFVVSPGYRDAPTWTTYLGLQGPRGRAGNGTVPTNPNPSVAVPPLDPIDTSRATSDFKEFFDQQATSGEVTEIFPGLRPQES